MFWQVNFPDTCCTSKREVLLLHSQTSMYYATNTNWKKHTDVVIQCTCSSLNVSHPQSYVYYPVACHHNIILNVINMVSANTCTDVPVYLWHGSPFSVHAQQTSHQCQADKEASGTWFWGSWGAWSSQPHPNPQVLFQKIQLNSPLPEITIIKKTVMYMYTYSISTTIFFTINSNNNNTKRTLHTNTIHVVYANHFMLQVHLWHYCTCNIYLLWWLYVVINEWRTFKRSLPTMYVHVHACTVMLNKH